MLWTETSEVAKMASDHAAHALPEWLEHIGAPDAAQLLVDAIQTYSCYARHYANTPDPSDSFEPIFLPEPARKTARAAGLKEH